MTATTTGWIVFLAALGMMAGLLGAELGAMKTFGEAWTPAFVGKTLIHFGTVVGAFIGGKLIPTSSTVPPHSHKRKTDDDGADPFVVD